MSHGNYLYLPAQEALRWFKVLAVFRCATARGEPPGFALPPGRLPVRLSESDGNLQLLVVDDQPLLREAVGEYLAIQGYAVYSAGNGAEAMTLLEQGLRPDLVLCDVVLPDISGDGLIREARMFISDLKVLFMSGHVCESLHPDINESNFLQKPFRLDMLACRIRALLTCEMQA